MWKRFFRRYFWVPITILWLAFGQPIWNLNIERMAEQNGLDDLGDAAQQVDPGMIPDWVRDVAAFLTGDFLWGVAVTGSAYLAFDLAAWFRRRKAPVVEEKVEPQKPLSSLYQTASHLRKDLQAAVQNVRSRPRASSNLVHPDLAARTRSLSALFVGYGIQPPLVEYEMTVENADAMSHFLGVAEPYIGRSQVAELRQEAQLFIQHAQKP